MGAGLVLMVAFGAARAMQPEAPIAPAGATPPTAPDPRHAAVDRPKANEDVPAPPPALDLSAPVIRQAIADSRNPLDDVVVPRGASFGSGDSTATRGIDQAFRRAEIPTCMTPEAYKFDPPQIGPFGLGGMLALPFLVHAIATGKCRY